MYKTIEALLTIEQVELVGKTKFKAITLDHNNEISIIYIVSLISTNICSLCSVQIALLI